MEQLKIDFNHHRVPGVNESKIIHCSSCGRAEVISAEINRVANWDVIDLEHYECLGCVLRS